MGVYSPESASGGGRHYKVFFFRNSRQNKEFWEKMPFFGDILPILGWSGRISSQILGPRQYKDFLVEYVYTHEPEPVLCPLIITINQVAQPSPALQNINLLQNEADPTDFSRLMNPVDDELVEGVSAVVAAEAKNKDDDLDLALDALRDCDTDFIKFDQVVNITSVMSDVF